MAKDTAVAYSLPNLTLAWQRINTSPQIQFKDYFRDVYEAYAVASAENLGLLREKLTRGYFEPQPACKLFFPKPSGILRPYTLLCIEDQITYQALANVVAERLAPRVRHRYLKKTFGHVYAGRRSRFFYRDWRACRAGFARAMREAYAQGMVHRATFDLTACYDSIDHSVLQHYLESLGVDSDIIQVLARCLRSWTSAHPDGGVRQNHGIPQGPLASGLLAEVVLAQFDASATNSASVRYFRYVDDIRLLGRTEHDLRHVLVDLDLVSKQIGLFPQSNKISIGRIGRIEDEIRGVSQPPEIGLRPAHPDQGRIRARMRRLTHSHRVADPTRFKWVLAQALPSKPLTRRLLRVLRAHPDLYAPICRYLHRHTKLHPEISGLILEHLREEDLYASVCAGLLRAVIGRVPAEHMARYTDYARDRYTQRTKLPGQAELRAACGAWLLSARQMGYQDTRNALTRSLEWWVRKELLGFVEEGHIGAPSYSSILNLLVRDPMADVSLVAAYQVGSRGIAVEPPLTEVNPVAVPTLKRFGVVARAGRRQCAVAQSLARVLGESPTARSWRTVLGRRYRDAERITVRAKGCAETDATAWVNVMDTFNDVLLEALCGHDASIGTYQPGRLGAFLQPAGRFATRYPRLFQAVAAVHELRLRSDYSHARVHRTGKPTGRITFEDLKKVMPRLRRGYEEVHRKW
jgi:predicted DNA-binding WGR domain protein